MDATTGVPLPGERERYIPIATFLNEIDAELAQATLAAAGIESLLDYESLAGMIPSLQQSEGIRVLVDERMGEEAKAVLSTPSSEQSDAERPEQ